MAQHITKHQVFYFLTSVVKSNYKYALDSYSGGPWFKSQLRHSTESSLWFSSLPQGKFWDST